MKTMRIEKNLNLHDTVDEVASLHVSEALKYNKEEDGIRAVGPLYIKGQYLHEGEQKPFQEVLDMDVLAPNEKLMPNETFDLEVMKYEGIPSEDGIRLHVQMGIHGLREDSKVNEPVEVSEASIPQPISEPITQPQPVSEPISQPQPVAVPVRETAALAEEAPLAESIDQGGELPPAKEPTDISELEDLFEGTDSVYTPYRMIVAKPDDTYATIAQRYEVDESVLRDTNRSKDIFPKTLVVLPFGQGK